MYAKELLQEKDLMRICTSVNFCSEMYLTLGSRWTFAWNKNKLKAYDNSGHNGNKVYPNSLLQL